MIKVICFDLDGVYFTKEGKKAFHKSLADLSSDEEKVSYVLDKSPEMHKFVTGAMNEQELWDFHRNYLNISLSNQEFEKLLVKEYKIDEEVRKIVLKTREKGYIACVCSNNSVVRVRALEKKFNFLSDFDVKIFSHEVGFVKPSKEIFQALIDKSGVNPDEIIYSDDNPEKIKGAGDLGINVFVYENFPQFLGKLRELGIDLG
ncbi:MAG: HAD family phosphatase [bacterium]|nr:HAD family phosphatase [bacterium]